mmetsp:Transcript_35291/g.51854  ORF Transcript_35291/g.51854 Transcript_35291/m.51854 type:complete len:369 (+) Transcript_35291:906-2012(+)
MRPRANPQRLEHRVKRLNAIGCGRLGKRRQRQRCDGAHLLLLIREPCFHDLNHLLEVRQHSTAHKNCNLLNDLDTCVPSLPRLLTLAHSLEEGQQRGDAERRGHDSKGTRRGVTHILVQVVDIGTHSGNHRGQPSSLRQVGNNFAPLNARIIVLVDEQRLNHHEDFVHIRAHEVVELVEHAVNNFDQQMPLLVFQSRRHEERKDLVEKWARSKFSRLVRELSKRLLPHGRGAVFDLEQKLHNFALIVLVLTQFGLVYLLHKSCKELVVFGLDKRQPCLPWRLRHAVGLSWLVCGHGVAGCPARSGSGKQLARGCFERFIARGRLKNLIAVCGEESIQLLVDPRPVSLIHILLEAHFIHLLRCHGDLAN